MGKKSKILVFIFVCFMIFIIVHILSGIMTSPVIYLGVIAIPIIYKSMFGKKDVQEDSQSNEITLNKENQDEKEIDFKE